MNQYLKAIQDLLQQNKQLSEQEKEAVIKAIGDADKQWSITDFKLDRTEKVKKTTAILLEETIAELEQKRKAVEAQNRELEIESSLERVRTVAMSMRIPADMLEICKTISHQLELLNIKEIRNVQTMIFQETRETYINYEYYAKHDKLLTTEVNYNLHAEHAAFAHQMKKGPGEFYTQSFTGKKLKDWYEYQKSTPQFADVYLEQATSLNYYMYSLGKVVLGISTYVPLKEEEINLFKRYRNVFELSYRRYLDIEQAEAQAREAQIQLALERVRARTMAMQHSNELADTASVLFQQIKELGFETWSCGFCIWQKNDLVEVWMGADSGGLLPPMLIPYKKEPTHQKINEDSLTGEPAHHRIWEKAALQKHYAFLKTIPSVKEAIDILEKSGLSLPERQCYYVGFFEQGYLLLITKEPNDELKALSKRFSKVFEQTYTRFLDLQKAEAQAREAQIQLSLERVRAKAMAMHHSEELDEVLSILFDQFDILGINPVSTHISLVDLEKNMFRYRETGRAGHRSMSEQIVDLDAMDTWKEAVEKWKKGDPLSVNILHFPKEAIPQVWEVFSVTYNGMPDEAKITPGDYPDGIYVTEGYCKFGYIGMNQNRKATKEEEDIVLKFATEFGRLYQRFLDLKKAEAQARESKIEAALERVRARTMAMQRSEELSNVATVLFQQVKSLGVPQWTCGFCIWDIGDTGSMWYPGSPDGEILAPARFPLTEHPVFRIMDESRKRGDELYIYEKEGEVQADHYRYMMTLPGVGELLQGMLDAGLTIPTFQIDHYANFAYGNLIFITYEHFPEMHDIFKRFAKVFEQTYTRFLDLKKAEAQAREAKLETALERVRARTMAMQKSDELDETNMLIFRQLESLDITLSGTGIHICYADKPVSEAWMGDPLTGKMPKVIYNHTHDRLSEKMYEGWKKGETLLVEEVKGEKLKEHLEYVLPLLPDPTIYEDSIQEFVFHIVYFTYGFFVLATPDHCPTEHPVFIRFAKVFDQTYTRFLDLQKAEAQAREAKIEAALERVRSRSLAMHKSDELQEVVATVFERMKDLEIEMDTSSIIVPAKNENEIEYWFTNAEGYLTGFHLPYFDNLISGHVFNTKRSGSELFSYSYTFKEKNEFWNYLVNHTDFKRIPENRKKFILDAEAFTISIAFSKNTGIQINRYDKKPFSEKDNEILKRFARVFEQAYTRFLDLQKAEAQAREAIKQASVDRVRAEIASMRTTNDLERIQPLIWTELKILGIPFIRCGVFIMDEERQEVQTMLSTPEGKAIATLHVPFEFNLSIITNGVDHWRKKKMYKEHWDAAAFTKAWIKLSSLRETSMDASQAQHPPESLYLHLLPFLQGMLYVGNETTLNDDELNLVQNLTDAFSTAYARYEDFNKLEAAKKQVDSTLNELQTTQKQLIQSEKMASLGELTAGIAHEIQNPLNFVNNFSEVNKELLVEMKDEIEKGNIEEVKAIANDIIGNEEKINHHGKRADAIVKGMLQHSRSSSGIKEPTDINVLADEYLRLAYHGLRAKDKSFNATMKTNFDDTIGKINIVPQDIGRAVLNLITNAFYAAPLPPEGGFKDLNYKHEPTVWVSTKKIGDKVLISVRDNGPGIPQKILDKIFQPFFTTKPTGQGTGLGLSLAYDIVKAHGGELKVETKEGSGSEFIIQLPA